MIGKATPTDEAFADLLMAFRQDRPVLSAPLRADLFTAFLAGAFWSVAQVNAVAEDGDLGEIMQTIDGLRMELIELKKRK